MAYMARKTQKRQSAIVSLNDNNQEELSKIQKQKEEMIGYYEQLKNGEKSFLYESTMYMLYTARVAKKLRVCGKFTICEQSCKKCSTFPRLKFQVFKSSSK